MAKLAQGAVFLLAVWMVIAAWAPAFGQENPPASATEQGDGETGKATDEGLVIEPEELPQTYPHGDYHVQFQAGGNYVPVLQWRVESGALPPGIRLEEHGLLHGSAERAGEFHFVVSVRDGGQPRQAVQRGYVIKVVDAMTVAWKTPPHVAGTRIEGSVEVSNTAADDMDLTFDVKAVAENGRATEIGYQHFPLKRGTMGMRLPFGENLPHGAYMVNVTVVGEVARRNAIYREMLETPAPLQVTVGP
ncbi:MAG: hypothetical protein WBV55_15870 [Candidatus Sulfotelmatobacter sp.]